MRRDDLLALDEAKLAELATRGHVKKAQKDLAAGRRPRLAIEADGTVVATSDDGVVTRLVAGRALRDTECTCPAARVCGHRVLAVLAYRDEHGTEAPAAPAPWSPAGFDDAALEALLGRTAWRRANERRRRGYVARVARGVVPSVELPTATVRFLVEGELGYARCDCAAGLRCEHVALAVWAFRRADELHEGAADATVELRGEDAAIEASALEPALELVRELLLDGAVGSGAALGARFARARRPLEAAHLVWPRTICEDLEETLASYADRAASYHPERVGELATELHARARAASREGAIPARAILGADEPDETALEHARLVSLGCRLSIEPSGDGPRARADVFLADPDTGAVLVLRRGWSVAEGEAGAALATRHVARGIPLGVLARGQLVTRAARRGANQALTLTADRGGLARTSVTPQAGAWDALAPPLFADDFAALAAALRERPPRFVRPRHLADRIRVLAVRDVSAVAYDPATQTLCARLHDRAGGEAHLALAHSRAAPRAIDALAAALDAGVSYVSGEVRREGDAIHLVPLAVVTRERVIALDLDAPSAARLPAGAAPEPDDPVQVRLIEARALLDRGAHAGLRHVGEAWRDELGETARRLAEVSLSTCADRLRALHAALAGRIGGDPEAEASLATAWLDASLRVRLALEAG